MTFKNELKNTVNDNDAPTNFFTAGTSPIDKGNKIPSENYKRNQPVSLLLTAPLLEKITIAAKEQGISRNAYITMALNEYLKK